MQFTMDMTLNTCSMQQEQIDFQHGMESVS